MDKFDLNSLPDVPDIPASIVASGLSDAPLTTLVEIAMQRLVLDEGALVHGVGAEQAETLVRPPKCP